jgi:hypothetical protein
MTAAPDAPPMIGCGASVVLRASTLEKLLLQIFAEAFDALWERPQNSRL